MRAALVLVLLLATVGSVAGQAEEAEQADQAGQADTTADHPGAFLRIQLLTAAAGDAVWEKFGHNALRIIDTSDGSDVSWNWGLFSFADEGFILRLARGTMMYWMGGYGTAETLEQYRRAGRTVWAQELNLTPEEKWELRRLVLENFRPENRYYRYDYYRDNCSTRIRDLVDEVTGGRLRAATADTTDATYRWHTRRLLRDSPFAYAGIQYFLGNPVERPLTGWEEMFLPFELREHLGRTTVVRDGEEEPLVLRETVLLDAGSPPEPERVPFRLAHFLAVGLAWAGLAVWASIAAARGGGVGRLAFLLTGGAWAFLSGLCGLVLALGWAFTDHVFWRWNENLLQTGPWALLLAAALLPLLWRRRVGDGAVVLARVVAALSVAGLLLQLLPGFDQTNGEIIALALPVNLALVYATAVLRGTAPGGDDRAEGAAALPRPDAAAA